MSYMLKPFHSNAVSVVLMQNVFFTFAIRSNRKSSKRSLKTNEKKSESSSKPNRKSRKSAKKETTSSSIISDMGVLNVAEKNDAAKHIAGYLSGGNLQRVSTNLFHLNVM